MSKPFKALPVYRPQTARVAAPPVFRPGAAHQLTQPKQAISLQLESRPAPPVYCPQPNRATATQTKPAHLHKHVAASSTGIQTRTVPVTRPAEPQYELSSPVWVGSGRQQIRVKAKGSPASIGSVDVHYRQTGKAYISDLNVTQGHRRHGVGTMLMKAAMDTARRSGNTLTELEARPGPGSISNQALSGMYQKVGFRSAGTSQRGNPKMVANAGVQQKPAASPFKPGTRTLPHRVAIQRMEAVAMDESTDDQVVDGEAAARMLVKYIFGEEGTDNNWTAGALANGDLLIGKVNGVTSATAFTVKLKAYIKKNKIEKGRDIYLAKVFHGGSSRHAEMCVLAAADALGKKVTFMICVAPNCDFCARMLKDAGVTSACHQGSDPTSQQGWMHPRKKVAYGTQLPAPLGEQLAELKDVNSGTVKEGDIEKGQKQGVSPQGQSEKWL